MNAYHQFAEFGLRVGPWIFGVGIAGFLLGFAVAVMHLFSTGDADGTAGATEIVKAPLPTPPPDSFTGASLRTGIVKQKVFFSRGTWITNKALADGTATPAQRKTVVGIATAIVSCLVAIAGGGLWALASEPLATVLAICAVFTGGRVLWGALQDYRNEKAKALRRRAHPAGSSRHAQ